MCRTSLQRPTISATHYEHQAVPEQVTHFSKRPPPPSYKANKFVVTRLRELERVMSMSRKAHAATPHWYTLTLGVEPASQGKGLGAKLTRAVGQMADEAGEACYLETSGQRNRSWYQHLGYEEKDCYTVGPAPHDSPDHEPIREFYAMVRPPKGR